MHARSTTLATANPTTDVPLLPSIVLTAAIVTTGLAAGVFALYAHTLMPGLKNVDDRTFVAAWQATDRAIINPWFMTCFFGALVLIGAAALLHLPDGTRGMVPWLAAAFVLYLIAVVMTMTIHLPLNDAIKAAGDPDTLPDLAKVRADFDEARWTFFNLIRTWLGIGAFALLVIPLVINARQR
jgi:uncharacterized membrane protein